MVGFVGLNRQFVAGETQSFGNDLSRPECGCGMVASTNRTVNPMSVQFHDSPANLACKGLPLRAVNFLQVLQMTHAKSTPEIRKVPANLCPVARKPSDGFRARWRREFWKRLAEGLTNTLTSSMAALHACDPSPAGSQLRRQFQKS
jgi:hypothetical protein